MLPQSRNTTVRSAMSAGGAWIRPSSAKKRYSKRQRQILGRDEHHRVLAQRAQQPLHRPPASPARRRRDARARRARSASPRGSARAPARASTSVLSAVAHPGPRSPRSARPRASRGRSCRRRRTRASACASGAARAATLPCRKPCALRRPVERRLALASRRAAAVAEHAHVHASMAQIGACSDICHGHKSHSRVLQLSCHRIAEHLANRLVDAAHTSRAHPTLPAL